jgi:hypothetical protein
MSVVFQLFGGIIRWIIRGYVESIVCQHFRVFKEGGSDFGYTHVHICYPEAGKPSGVGHDDNTNARDPKHNTVSEGDACGFKTRAEVDGPEKPGESGAVSFDMLGGKVLTTAYFHECEDGRCPWGYERIRCRCRDDERTCCVCYTLDRDAFEAFYEGRNWPDSRGEVRAPYLNIAGPVPPKIACKSSVILYAYELLVVDGCDAYGSAKGGTSMLMTRAEQRLRAAAAGIVCDGPCQLTTREIWRGWKCKPVGSSFHAHAAIQWELRCG